ncbi:C45 family autoproteolytic acyltransferase/hydolase [Bacillus sp. WLY-B-L8]|uniref:C45 family autoproteolytic acyltransferase/hydolase n=1 Tax=Bacillus multifaciens TaxID=3068506 RepID=UPI002740A0CF|nr:C45 family peptidase [Bacillus sp. WLY-B-L8]MDP7978045.1 C45 family peptidase [Bacillus sp. WLY-B-L8]
MNSFQAYFSFLEGNSYEIGRKQGEEIKKNLHATNVLLLPESIGESKFKNMKRLIERYCPGLNEELEGFAEVMGVKSSYLNFYDEASLQPGGCSLGAILPSKTIDNKTYVLRNYDLSPAISDLRLCTTKVQGKYSHTGFSVSYFGRSEGLNEKGFCVAFASCGIPVGKHLGMKKPVTKGLQFMIIVRALLENCKNVEEGICFLSDMPIGANMNLLLADANGEAALYETFDGTKAVRKTDIDYLIATNHAIFPEIESLEIGRLIHSQIRFNVLERKFSDIGKRSVGELKKLISTEFPEGLSVHNYQENFGTVHSVLFNLTDCQLEFSFGSPVQNKIYKIGVADSFSKKSLPIMFQNREYGTDFWRVSK